MQLSTIPFRRWLAIEGDYRNLAKKAKPMAEKKQTRAAGQVTDRPGRYYGYIVIEDTAGPIKVFDSTGPNGLLIDVVPKEEAGAAKTFASGVQLDRGLYAVFPEEVGGAVIFLFD